MAIQPLLILYGVIAFSFIITSLFMFKPKSDETGHIIFFWLAVALASLATFINATAIPAGESVKTIVAWCGLLLAAVGIIVRMIAGKTNAAANILVMLSTVYACGCYFIF